VRAGLIALGLVAVLAACDGDGADSSSQVLPAAGFADKAAAAIITQSELRAAPGSEPLVSVSAEDSLDVFSLRLREEYAEYKANPSRLDAILRTVVDEAEATMERGNAERSFANVRRQVLPILKPLTALRGVKDEPVTTRFPGSLRVAYLVQRDDSVTAVTPRDLERWDRSASELHGLAVENLLRQTNEEEPLGCEEQLCGWASGDGYDAVRMIVPELRRQIVREIGGPAVYAVPTESVYVALPIRLADRIRTRVEQQFVSAENPVSQDLFVERDGELVVLPR
jgi:uncharacterized protein YtpQ (UPF0354 family)